MKCELTHDSTTEFRALADIDGSDRLNDYYRVRFDIYGGPGRGPHNNIAADCHISVEQRKNGRQRSTYASAALDLSEMMELYALLGAAIERAERALSEVAA